MWLPRAIILAVSLSAVASSSAIEPATAPASSANDEVRLLTTTAAIRRLTAEQASQKLPVRLRGTVTYLAGQPALMFVQDETGGICVSGPRERRDPARPQVKIGAVVEVEGVTAIGPGGVGSPYIVARARGELVKVNVVDDTPSAPSPARVVALADLTESAGAIVETTAIVRAVRLEPQPIGAAESLVLTLASGADRIEAVLIAWPAARALPRQWVGTTVRVRGIYNAAAPERQQVTSQRLLIPLFRDIRAAEPATQPFALPVTSIADLRGLGPQEPLPVRARVRGSVTLVVPGKGMYVQDGAAGMWVAAAVAPVLGAGSPSTQPAAEAKSGDMLDLVGFPVRRGLRTVLEDPEWRSGANGPLPVPPLVTADQALTGEFDASLVAIQALVLGVSRPAEGPTLVLQSGERVFLARLNAPGSTLPVGENTWVRLTGVCVNNRLPDAPDSARPVSFHVLLSDPQAVQVMATPSWWTLRHLLAIGGGLLAITLAAFGWVLALRRRVAQQTKLLRGHVARETLNEERMRMARELHDSLEQDLLGITLQLTATEKLLGEPLKARDALQLAAAMVRRSKDETHRAVWDLRAAGANGDGNGLVANLREAVAGLTPAAGPRVEVQVSGDARALPPQVENHVQRVALEAVANAIKHAGARRIDVRMEFNDEHVMLRVSDDGRGFDATRLPALSSGHFGLFGMKERAEKVKGELTIESRQGQGTEVKLRVPVKTAEAERK
jgi:signal transduction histidine kinase